MKLIAITQRSHTDPGHLHGHDMLDPRLSQLLMACELLPLILPTDKKIAYALCRQLKPEGILLSGGNNTDEREALETSLIHYAIEYNIPLLGICHGMQAIQKHYGLECTAIEGHIMTEQLIAINQKNHIMNAYHDKGTHLTTENLLPWATHKDGTIKAIKDKSHLIYGIMWHPERQPTFYPSDLTFIKALYSGDNTCEQSY